MPLVLKNKIIDTKQNQSKNTVTQLMLKSCYNFDVAIRFYDSNRSTWYIEGEESKYPVYGSSLEVWS